MSATDITILPMSVAVITRIGLVARWKPDAVGRLQQAALELFVERGYDNTTVADIAERAELTERTFFRHFADKREVLFSGTDLLREVLTSAVAAAPTSMPPIEMVGAALEAASALLQERQDVVPLRQSVIAAHSELRERELIKLASFADVLADALRKRGVKDPAATLTAEAGIAAFKIAYDRWAADPTRRNLARLLRETLHDLKTLTAGDTPRRRRNR
jgi:AcrR family transcriptional regulator